MPGILRRATPRFHVRSCSGLPGFQPPVHPRHGRQRHWYRCCPLAGRRRRSGTSHRLQEPPTDKARETVLHHTPGAVGRGDVLEAIPPLSDGPAIPAVYRPWISHLAAQLPRAGGSAARWLEKLQELDFGIVHRRDKKHTNADALSRLPCRQCGRESHTSEIQGTISTTSMQPPESEPVP